jgi:hypothetical protein
MMIYSTVQYSTVQYNICHGEDGDYYNPNYFKKNLMKFGLVYLVYENATDFLGGGIKPDENLSQEESMFCLATFKTTIHLIKTRKLTVA